MRIARFLRLVTVFVLAGACEQGEQYETIYVVPTVLNVRKGPSVRHAVVTQVRRGQELKIVSRQAPWLNVLLADETQGWVHGNYVGSPADVRAGLDRDLKRRQGISARRRISKPVRRSKELTIDGLLADLPGEIPTEILPPLEGLNRVMGATREGQIVVEFWVDEDKLQKAMMMVTVLNVEDADLNTNVLYAFGFVKNALPGLKRDREWMHQRLKEISSRDTGTLELQAKGRTVSFEFIKVLSSVRVTDELRCHNVPFWLSFRR